MQHKESLLPTEIYNDQLNKINGISFTKREVDVLSCLLFNSSLKTCPSLLSISSKTIASHLATIKVKIGAGSRDDVIVFLEKSDQYPLLKTTYYSSLLIQSFFEKQLRKIPKVSIKCLFILEKEQPNTYVFLKYVKQHLIACGIKPEIYYKDPSKDEFNFWEEFNLDSYSFVFSTLPETVIKDLEGPLIKSSNFDYVTLSKGDSLNLSNLIFICPLADKLRETIKQWSNIPSIESNHYTNYYLSFLYLLQKIYPSLDINPFVSALNEYCKEIKSTSEITLQKSKRTDSQEPSKFISKPRQTLDFRSLPNKKMKLVIYGFLCILVLSSSLFFYYANNRHLNSNSLIRSMLALPTDSILFDRSKLITNMNQKLNDKGIQSIALIGVGGAGKTTLARTFARAQQSNIVWEINAETPENMATSFENLATALALNEKDLSKLHMIQKIENSQERENKILQYVKDHLKEQGPWILIYDNVEKFEDILNHFPHDPRAWGDGKVIITTRNNSIESNNHVNHVLHVLDMPPDHKLALFMQIMTHGDSDNIMSEQRSEYKKFLENIPPYPLDVSIAANYLKSTNVSPEKYLEYMKANDSHFMNMQNDLLHESGEYLHNRYSIIKTSIENILNDNKDFSDLLLLISLIDSQNIPLDLLKSFKGDLLTDNFIYHLKKYSLINQNTSNISIHRSTQAIILNYLTNQLNLKTDKQLLDPLIHSLEKYCADAIEKENHPRITVLKPHFEAFVSRENLLSRVDKATIEGQLGGMYATLGDYTKAKKILERSLSHLADQQSNNQNLKTRNNTIAHLQVYLGSVYWRLKYYGFSKDLLENYRANFMSDPNRNPLRDAQALFVLGDSYSKLGNHTKADEALRSSLNIYKIHYSHISPLKIANVYGLLALNSKKLENWEHANQCLEEAYKIYIENKKTLYENKILLAHFLKTLGDINRRFYKFERGKELFLTSLDLYRSQFAEDHIDIAFVLADLGDNESSMGNLKDALVHLNEAESIYKRNNIPDNNFDLALTLAFKGIVHVQLGEIHKAKENLEQSYDMYCHHSDKTLGNWVQAYLCDVYTELGDYGKAQESIENCLKTYEKMHGKNHSFVGWITRHQGNFYLTKAEESRQDNDIQKAKKCFEFSLSVYNVPYGEGYIEYARALRDLGRVYLLQKDLKNAEEYIQKSLSIFNDHHHPESYLALLALADVYREKSQDTMEPLESKTYHNQAVSYLKEANEVINKSYPDKSPHLEKIKMKMAQLNS